jgi:hypothetical protein
MKNSVGVLFPALLLLAFFIYFFRFTPYHLLYLEQSRLFCFDRHFAAAFFQVPGGFIRLAGTFVTQFFLTPLLAAILVSLLAAMVYFLSAAYFRSFGLTCMLYPALPVVILAGFQSNHNFQPDHTLAWIIVLAFALAFRKRTRGILPVVTGIAGWVLLYVLTGCYAFAALLLLLVLRAGSGRKEFALTLASGLLLAVAVPMLMGRFMYVQPYRIMWLSPVENLVTRDQAWLLVLWLVCYLVIPAVHAIPASKKILQPSGWNAWLSGSMVFLAVSFFVIRHAYDRKNEIFLHIDHAVQHEKWNEVLRLSRQYPGSNRMVMVYTNLALYKTGRLGDDFFSYRQAGVQGMWLPWKRNETAPFFAGEVLFELGYTNEAFRWAFETMEARGMNPRCLKRLAITSLINGHFELAAKYLHFLGETVAYRRLANHYQSFVLHPETIDSDPVLKSKRALLIHEDFIAGSDEDDPGLFQLLENHPDNQMAFEYLMMTLLLHKDLPSFSARLKQLPEFGYTRIPRLYEEATLLYAGMNKEYTLPQGLVISPETRDRFHRYASVFAVNRGNIAAAASALRREFGNTYWYYMQFAELQKPADNETM